MLIGIYISDKNTCHFPDWIKALTSLLDNNYSMDLNIDELIKTTNDSHSHVCREFKTDFSVQQIAVMAGYSNSNNFINQFKEIYKISPFKWRKQYNSNKQSVS